MILELESVSAENAPPHLQRWYYQVVAYRRDFELTKMDDLIAQLDPIRALRVWYGFFGAGGHFNLHKLSYSKLLELARRHGWHSSYDIKEPTKLTKTGM